MEGSTNRTTRSNSTSSDPANNNKASIVELKPPKDKIDAICTMLKQLQKTVESNQKTSDERFRSLESKLTSQTDAWKSEINNILAKHLFETNNKYNELEKKVSSVHNKVDEKFEDIERQNRQNDILIRGVPIIEKENLFKFYDTLAAVLKFPYDKMYVLSSIFRFKSKIPANSDNEFRPPPILLKFSTPILKRAFFNNFLKHKNLKLSDIGFNSPDRIFFSDNLTKKNSKIFTKVAEMKKSNIIDKFQVRNGFVYAKFSGVEKFTKINCINELLAYQQVSSLNNSPFDLNKTILQSENAEI